MSGLRAEEVAFRAARRGARVTQDGGSVVIVAAGGQAQVDRLGQVIKAASQLVARKTVGAEVEVHEAQRQSFEGHQWRWRPAPPARPLDAAPARSLGGYAVRAGSLVAFFPSTGVCPTGTG